MAFPRPRTPVNSQPLSIASGLRTPPDQEMSDQPMSVQPSPRPLLPTSSADFALSAPVSPSTSVMAIDDQPMLPASPFASPSASGVAAAWNHNAFSAGQLPSAAAYPLLRKLRRPSLLGPLGGPGPSTLGTPSRLNSPLITSFTSSNSPFGFEPATSRSSSSSGKQAQRIDEDSEEYTPVLLTYEGRDGSREGSSSASGSGSSSRNPRQRYHRSMSPQTPPSRTTELDGGLTNEDVASSSRKRPTRNLLRRTSSSNSVTDPPATSSTTQPIPVGGQPPSLLSSQARKLTIPRLRSLVSAETNPAEVEVKSEARFQRFVASHAEFPTPFKSYPKTPRSRAGSSNAGPGGTNLRKSMWPSEKGRFPEEALADDEEFEDDNSVSSDGFDAEGSPEPPGTAPMSFTEDGMLSSSLGGGALGIHRGSSGSLGPPLESPAGMDLDVAMTTSWGPGSPPVSVNGGSGMMITSTTSTPNPLWRHTPPPTAAGPSRVGKRKFDDRYDPYPSAKRRAVSPAVSISISPYHSHPSLASPITLPRSSPITIPRPLPVSAASSPVMRPIVRLSGQYANGMGSTNGSAVGMGLLGVSVGGNGNPNPKREKEVNGAGDGVGSLTLSSRQ